MVINVAESQVFARQTGRVTIIVGEVEKQAEDEKISSWKDEEMNNKRIAVDKKHLSCVRLMKSQDCPGYFEVFFPQAINLSCFLVTVTNSNRFKYNKDNLKEFLELRT